MTFTWEEALLEREARGEAKGGRDSVQRLEEILDQAIVASSVDELVLEA